MWFHAKLPPQKKSWTVSNYTLHSETISTSNFAFKPSDMMSTTFSNKLLTWPSFLILSRLVGFFCVFKLNMVSKKVHISDEPELEFSGSSRSELGKFQAELSWGTLISELNRNCLNSFFPQVFIIRSPVSWFQSILWSFIWTFVFLKVNNLIQMHNLVNFIIENRSSTENWNFSSFFSQFSIPSWSEKGHEPSQAENPSARAVARASSAWAHH